MGAGHIPSKPVGAPTWLCRRGLWPAGVRPLHQAEAQQNQAIGESFALPLLYRNKNSRTTGNRVNQIRKRKLNAGKVKEGLNPFSRFFFKLDKDPAISENHGKPYPCALCPDFNYSLLIMETLIIPPGILYY